MIATANPDRIYEVQIEVTDGFTLPDGDRWTGYRIRYRELRAPRRGRWAKFLLVDPDAPPTVEQLQLLCHAHATRTAA